MTASNKTRWEKWAEGLRQAMIRDLEPQVTKSIDQIADETGIDKTPSMLNSRRFWNACQAGKSPNDTLNMERYDLANGAFALVSTMEDGPIRVKQLKRDLLMKPDADQTYFRQLAEDDADIRSFYGIQ